MIQFLSPALNLLSADTKREWWRQEAEIKITLAARMYLSVKSSPTRKAESERISQRRKSTRCLLADGKAQMNWWYQGKHTVFFPLVLQICRFSCGSCMRFTQSSTPFSCKTQIPSSGPTQGSVKSYRDPRAWCDPLHRSSEHEWCLTVDFLMKYFQLVISQIVIQFCWQDWGRKMVSTITGKYIESVPRKLCYRFLRFPLLHKSSTRAPHGTRTS